MWSSAPLRAIGEERRRRGGEREEERPGGHGREQAGEVQERDGDFLQKGFVNALMGRRPCI
ncbi:MAG: hypothetical protein M3377_02640 [Actinomycetota bacterium]|nr:hypothetical protein [Actinomycetota bacterium]